MAGTKIPMAELTQLYSEKDDIYLPVLEEHVLWRNEYFPNISSRAAWNQYQAVIDDPQLQHWCKKENGHTQSIIDCRSWKVFKEAIDRAYRYLTNEDVALERATVTLPVILRIGQNIKEKFARGAASLCIYIRIDFNTDAQVYLQSKERMEVEIECGTMFIVSGYQRHRLTGDGVVIAFHIDLPSISRSEVLNKIDELQGDLNDESIFYSAVAQPISRPLPSFECIKEKINWLDHRAYKRYRRFECPVIKKYLLENDNPQLATQSEKDIVRRYGNQTSVTESHCFHLKERISVLTGQQCFELVQFIDDNISSAVIDSVDDFPEYQVDVSPELLAQLVGKETCQAVLNLPKILDKSLLHGKSSRLGYSLFLRLYSQETRSQIPFHHDISDYTCVIALNDQSDFSGGDFIMLNGDNLEKASWKQGEALLHSGNLIHGVSKMNAGKRYSLVMFADHVE
jgi:hypothetical protein